VQALLVVLGPFADRAIFELKTFSWWRCLVHKGNRKNKANRQGIDQGQAGRMAAAWMYPNLSLMPLAKPYKHCFSRESLVMSTSYSATICR
jgi:hypothetical protein